MSNRWLSYVGDLREHHAVVPGHPVSEPLCQLPSVLLQFGQIIEWISAA
jgi:hypothetical protein